MSRTEERPAVPRATIHKQILDVAEADPDLTMAEIAESVSGASVDVVERVFEEYGDPHAEPASQGNGSTPPVDGGSGAGLPGRTKAEVAGQNGDGQDDETSTDGHPETTGPVDLTDEQVETLRLIRERPEASQAELAEHLDVTRPTVSRRVNAIPGFDWDRRGELVDSLLDDHPETGTGGEALADVRRRLAAVERRLDGQQDATDGCALGPELAHKVVHACLRSDRLSEEDELRVLKALLS